MKKTILVLAITLSVGLCISFSASAQTVKADHSSTAVAKGPQITFLEKSHDFGDIKQGDKVNYTFKFKNTGTEPLILSNVSTTCGCTATNWTKDPVAPGQSGEVAATFNSAGKMSAQRKVITVYSNAVNAQETVTIISNVLPNEAGQQ